MRKTSKNQTLVYVIVIAVIVVAFLELEGGNWINGMMHQGRLSFMNHWDWTQIIISIVIGFVIGLFVAKKK
ncbi:MAG: hypothetical protein JXR51_06925 [Bacteroidales bacterium]|nr:hypothetical protein [Bacteroidales bacterium]